MKDNSGPKTMSDAHNAHHAKKRRERREAQRGKPAFTKRTIVRQENDRLFLYGLHTVRQALLNPNRTSLKLFCTKNGLNRLELDGVVETMPDMEEMQPRQLDHMVGSDAVHQGVVLEVEPLSRVALDDLGSHSLILVLDQVTDPHNVGAIMRSAVALGAGALVTTSRYSPVESGVLGKAASGALDLIPHIEVRNLAEGLETLKQGGFTIIGLDSEEAISFEEIDENPQRIALVLGSEGKGLRAKTRTCCDVLAKLDMPGPIKSLNVSNAAVLSLYLARQILAD